MAVFMGKKINPDESVDMVVISGTNVNEVTSYLEEQFPDCSFDEFTANTEAFLQTQYNGVAKLATL